MNPSTSFDDIRLLRLAGGVNFRDLGGYSTADGRRVRWKRLYRSGKLSSLTAEDVRQLAREGIQVVCDLRTAQERRHEPSVTGFSREHRAWDVDVGHHRLREAVAAPGATPQQVRDALTATYREMPWLYAEMYGAAIAHIVSGDLPLVFHCAGGKDRTGTLAALILRALGVPEDQVVDDYLLTDRFLDVQSLQRAPRVRPRDGEGEEDAGAGFSFLRTLSAEMRAPLLTCDAAYLRAALGAVEERHGSVPGYLEEVLGIDASGLAALRERLLDGDESV